MKKDSIIILSGGMDSTTLLYDKQEEIGLALTFDYGSKHNAKEIPFAKYHCEKLKINHIIITLAFINDYFKSNLLQNAGPIPVGTFSEEGIKSTVVPFRNGIMLSIAAGIAESNGLKKVMLANTFGAIYPDCRASFIEPMSRAIENGTYEGVKIVAPYTEIDKREIGLIGKKLGIDYAKTWTCYKGEDKHCGVCLSCIGRKKALNGFDNTEYQL